MEEADELSTQIAIVDHGKLVAGGTRTELIRLVGEQTRVDLKVNLDPDRVLAAWRAVPGVTRVSVEADKVTVLVEDSNVVLPRLFEATSGMGGRIASVDIREPSLETVFLLLTGHALRD